MKRREILGERIKRNTIIGSNDKIDIKNKLNASECRILKCQESKFKLIKG
jgi:hypothetical protein